VRSIADSGECVVKFGDEYRAQAMNFTAANYPPHSDEFDVAGVAAVPSLVVRPPRVSGSPVSLECKLYTLVPVGQGPGSATLVIGVLRLIHVRADILNDRHHIDIPKL